MKSFLDSEALEGHPEVGVLISGSREIETHEWSALESGVFSLEIRPALPGAADADGDGILHYSEIAAFVVAANDGLADPRARVYVFPGHPGWTCRTRCSTCGAGHRGLSRSPRSQRTAPGQGRAWGS